MNLQRRLGLAATGMAILAATVATMALGSPAANVKAASAKASQTSAEHPNQALDWNDLRRDVHRDEHAEPVEPAARGHRPHGDLRCLQRDRAPLHTALRPERRPERREPRSARSVTAGGGRCCRVYGSGRTFSDTSHAARRELCGRARGAQRRRRGRRTVGERGIAWGTEVAQAVLAWRAADGFGTSRPPFIGGTAVGQWRPIAPATSMSAQGLAFAAPFVVESNTQFRPGPPRGLAPATYADDLDAVKALGRRTGSTRTEVQTELAPFWRATRASMGTRLADHPARAEHLSTSESNRLLAVLQPRDGGHGVHDLERKAVLRRRSGCRDLAAADRRLSHWQRPHAGSAAGPRPSGTPSPTWISGSPPAVHRRRRDCALGQSLRR